MKKINLQLWFRKFSQLLIPGDFFSRHYGPEGPEFDRLRAWEPGDSFRSIDVSVSLRKSRFYVRIKEINAATIATFMVDSSASMFFASHWKTKRDFAFSLIRAMAPGFSANGNSIRGFIVQGGKITDFNPLNPPQSLFQPFQLSREKQSLNELNTLLRCALRLNKQPNFVFLFSDFLDEPDEIFLKRVNSIHDFTPVMISDPRETDYSLGSGIGQFHDLETNQAVLGEKAGNQRQILKQLKIHHLHFQTNFNEKQIIAELKKFISQRQKQKERRWNR